MALDRWGIDLAEFPTWGKGRQRSRDRLKALSRRGRPLIHRNLSVIALVYQTYLISHLGMSGTVTK